MISLYGFYQYDNTIFDGVNLPSGMDKQTLIELIIEKSGMLYPFHQQPEFLKLNITSWFSRKYRSFDMMWKALNSEYNPIENYDRIEEWTDTPDVEYTKTGGHSNTIHSENDITGTNNVSAFNDNNMIPDTSGNSHSNADSRETFTYNTEKQAETGTRKHSGRAHGNIGVTTSQQMIESELRLRLFDIYETIAQMFEKNFLIQVY